MNSFRDETSSGISLFQEIKINFSIYKAEIQLGHKNLKVVPAYLLECVNDNVIHLLHLEVLGSNSLKLYEA